MTFKCFLLCVNCANSDACLKSVMMFSTCLDIIFCSLLSLIIYHHPAKHRYIPHFSGLYPLPFRLHNSMFSCISSIYCGLKFRNSIKHYLKRKRVVFVFVLCTTYYSAFENIS